MNSPTPVEASKQVLFMSNYLDTLCLVERLHRLLLDVIKDDLERLDIFLTSTRFKAFCCSISVKMKCPPAS